MQKNRMIEKVRGRLQPRPKFSRKQHARLSDMQLTFAFLGAALTKSRTASFDAPASSSAATGLHGLG